MRIGDVLAMETKERAEPCTARGVDDVLKDFVRWYGLPDFGNAEKFDLTSEEAERSAHHIGIEYKARMVTPEVKMTVGLAVITVDRMPAALVRVDVKSTFYPLDERLCRDVLVWARNRSREPRPEYPAVHHLYESIPRLSSFVADRFVIDGDSETGFREEQVTHIAAVRQAGLGGPSVTIKRRSDEVLIVCGKSDNGLFHLRFSQDGLDEALAAFQEKADAIIDAQRGSVELRIGNAKPSGRIDEPQDNAVGLLFRSEYGLRLAFKDCDQDAWGEIEQAPLVTPDMVKALLADRTRERAERVLGDASAPHP